MAKKTINPIELAQKYLIHIGINKMVVQKALLPALFDTSILCKTLQMSDLVLQNKKGSGSDETHIYINKSFTGAFYTQAQIATFNASPSQINNQLGSQTLKIFEANIAVALQRRGKKLSSSVVAKAPVGTYSISNNILTTSTTKWFNQHRGTTQLHIGQQSSDGNEFLDFRLGLLSKDILIMLRYANQDAILCISVPYEYHSKYNVIGTSKLSRKIPAKQAESDKRYEQSDANYSSSTDSPSITPEITPLSPQPPQSGSLRGASSKVKYKGKPSRGKGALNKANYKCEFDSSHTSFESLKTGKAYMEPHHLIPISRQDLYANDIDITSNLICLCPTCHKQIHHGTKNDVETMLNKFYSARHADLNTCGIDIDLTTLLAFYNIN